VPLGTLSPAQRKEDPWIVAARVFNPCYIGGWSACEHWGFTEQIFNNVVVVTGKKVRTRNNSIQGFGYLVRSVPPDKIFGTKTEWREQTKIQVSNPSKTIADILDDPSLGGGIRHIAHIMGEYFRQNTRNDEELLSCLEKNKNRAAYKRLGFLVEALKVNSQIIVETCRARMSKGYSMLDTTIKSKEKVLRRWNLWLNVTIEGQELY
jgi:predicted transcriptional regulator of viral defense system